MLTPKNVAFTSSNSARRWATSARAAAASGWPTDPAKNRAT
jgi:hypothetical protein